MRITIGLSTCPNDIFAFHALYHKKISTEGIDFDFVFLDVQELNERLLTHELDCSKASFHAALHLTEHYGILPAGAAIGTGVGPIVVSRSTEKTLSPHSHILCPGELTTAALLFRIAHPDCTRVEHRIFSDIMKAVQNADADFGVIIHEGRFTFEAQGLRCYEDLGTTWHQRTNSPLPLGGILAKRSLPVDALATLTTLIRSSLAYSYAHRDEVLASMQSFSQELDPGVIWAHVDLYVNDFTKDLGDKGQQALHALFREAVAAEVIKADSEEPVIL